MISGYVKDSLNAPVELDIIFFTGMRNMGDGRYIVQSWCPGCRLDDGKTPEIQFVCNTVKS